MICAAARRLRAPLLGFDDSLLEGGPDGLRRRTSYAALQGRYYAHLRARMGRIVYLQLRALRYCPEYITACHLRQYGYISFIFFPLVLLIYFTARDYLYYARRHASKSAFHYSFVSFIYDFIIM